MLEDKNKPFNNYKILVDGNYKNEISYLFDEMINGLNNGSLIKLTAFDMERLMDYVIKLNNDVEAEKLRLDRILNKLKNKYPYINI